MAYTDLLAKAAQARSINVVSDNQYVAACSVIPTMSALDAATINNSFLMVFLTAAIAHSDIFGYNGVNYTTTSVTPAQILSNSPTYHVGASTYTLGVLSVPAFAQSAVDPSIYVGPNLVGTGMATMKAYVRNAGSAMVKTNGKVMYVDRPFEKRVAFVDIPLLKQVDLESGGTAFSTLIDSNVHLRIEATIKGGTDPALYSDTLKKVLTSPDVVTLITH